MADPIDIGPLLKRRTVWDVIPHQEVPSFIPQMGLTPGSPEGDEKEHKASHRRMDLIGELEALVTVLAEYAGEAMARFILEYQQEDLPFIDDEMREAFEQQMIMLSINASSSVIANMIELDLLVVNEDGHLEL